MATVALPPPSEILSAIRTSSASLASRSLLEINPEAIDAFLDSIDPAKWAEVTGGSAHGIRLPLRFDDVREELNIISVLALFNFLSGYRAPLHRLTSRGAWLTILSLILSAHLSGKPEDTPLSTKGMLAATPASLAALAQIQTHTESDHPTLGAAVKMGVKDEEAFEILELLAQVCKSTGEVLRAEGKRNLGEWVWEKLGEANGDAGKLVYELARAFPAFCDAHEVDGQPVFLFKKALFLVSALHDRFAEDEEVKVPFAWPSVEGLPVFADNVLPTMLLHHKILRTSSSSDPLLATPPCPFLLPRESATRLRAAAVTACAAIVSRAHELAASGEAGREWMAGMTEAELDGCIWSGAKEGSLREVERMAERQTVYY